MFYEDHQKHSVALWPLEKNHFKRNFKMFPMSNIMKLICTYKEHSNIHFVKRAVKGIVTFYLHGHQEK